MNRSSKCLVLMLSFLAIFLLKRIESIAIANLLFLGIIIFSIGGVYYSLEEYYEI